MRWLLLAVLFAGCSTAGRCGPGYEYSRWTGLCLAPGEPNRWPAGPFPEMLQPGTYSNPVYVKPAR